MSNSNYKDRADAVYELARAYSVLNSKYAQEDAKVERDAISKAIVAICMFDLKGHQVKYTPAGKS